MSEKIAADPATSGNTLSHTKTSGPGRWVGTLPVTAIEFREAVDDFSEVERKRAQRLGMVAIESAKPIDVLPEQPDIIR